MANHTFLEKFWLESVARKFPESISIGSIVCIRAMRMDFTKRKSMN